MSSTHSLGPEDRARSIVWGNAASVRGRMPRRRSNASISGLSWRYPGTSDIIPKPQRDGRLVVGATPLGERVEEAAGSGVVALGRRASRSPTPATAAGRSRDRRHAPRPRAPRSGSTCQSPWGCNFGRLPCIAGHGREERLVKDRGGLDLAAQRLSCRHARGHGDLDVLVVHRDF